MTPPTARATAAAVLHRSRQRDGFAPELIDEAAAGLSPQDRRFVVQLVMGVIRRKGTLDALVGPFLTRPFDQLHPDTLDLLRLGVFQLVFLTQVPRHSAVDETVEITPPIVKKFVNAILRKVSDAVTDEYVGEMGPAAVPITAPLSRQGRGEFQKARPPAAPRPPPRSGRVPVGRVQLAGLARRTVAAPARAGRVRAARLLVQ